MGKGGEKGEVGGNGALVVGGIDALMRLIKQGGYYISNNPQHN